MSWGAAILTWKLAVGILGFLPWGRVQAQQLPGGGIVFARRAFWTGVQEAPCRVAKYLKIAAHAAAGGAVAGWRCEC
jgi:hypothetical protein